MLNWFFQGLKAICYTLIFSETNFSNLLQTLLISGKNGDVGKRESNMNVVYNIWRGL